MEANEQPFRTIYKAIALARKFSAAADNFVDMLLIASLCITLALPIATSMEICRGKNEEFSCTPSCAKTCQSNCPGYPQQNCASACVDKCDCKKGYLRDEISQECVEIEKCPSCPSCNGTNEHFSYCSFKCPSTCQNNCQYRGEVCDSFCAPRCECTFGYIRDELTNECIKPKKCPTCDCGKNEVFTRCNAKCNLTCQSPQSPPYCPSSVGCSPGCICADGYIRDTRSKKCVKIENCVNNSLSS